MESEQEGLFDMAGDWLPIKTDLVDEPEVERMARRLGIAPAHVVGSLVILWGWAYDHVLDGFLGEYDLAGIDRRAQCPGLAAAMVAVGWLELMPDGVRFPRWDEWLSKGAKKRLLEVRKKREQREAEALEARDERESCPVDVPQPTGQVRDYRTGQESNTSSLRSEVSAARPKKPKREPPNDVARLIEHFQAEWQRTRGVTWVWQRKEFILAAKVLRLAGESLPSELLEAPATTVAEAALAEAMRRTTSMLEQGEDAWIARNASVGVLLSRWNQLAVRVIRHAPEIADVKSKLAEIDAFFESRARKEPTHGTTPLLPGPGCIPSDPGRQATLGGDRRNGGALGGRVRPRRGGGVPGGGASLPALFEAEPDGGGHLGESQGGEVVAN